METESVVIIFKNEQVIIYGKKRDFARTRGRMEPFC
jgi:hypothetical protein